MKAKDDGTKQCSKCKILKTTNDFNKDKRTPDGYCRQCKQCRKDSQNTPKRREAKRIQDAKYSRTPKGREKSRKAVQKYLKSPKGKEMQRRYYLAHKERSLARDAVGKAVYLGFLPSVHTQKCAKANDSSPCEGKMEYHHHLGYEREHWLDVIPLCKKHHVEEDIEVISRRSLKSSISDVPTPTQPST